MSSFAMIIKFCWPEPKTIRLGWYM